MSRGSLSMTLFFSSLQNKHNGMLIRHRFAGPHSYRRRFKRQHFQSQLNHHDISDLPGFGTILHRLLVRHQRTPSSLHRYILHLPGGQPRPCFAEQLPSTNGAAMSPVRRQFGNNCSRCCNCGRPGHTSRKRYLARIHHIGNFAGTGAGPCDRRSTG